MGVSMWRGRATTAGEAQSLVWISTETLTGILVNTAALATPRMRNSEDLELSQVGMSTGRVCVM